ncbi:MAG: mechanosensitive ion channel [Oscillatoria sp. PMC 1051.18]|nr:mechanosensitive ion channel [Oscillatoria sp. PMC 1050.18]MEC5028794.1 mechanosensitive ion channel [Oscillatoria sp. PMC 1051.18]
MNAYNLILLALTGLLLFVYSFLQHNQDLVSAAVLDYLLVILLVCGSIAVVNVISFLVVEVWFPRKQGKQPSALLKLVISLILYGVCAIAILLLLGKNIATIFTTSAVLSAVLGFALQSTLGNFFEGVALRIDQPFQVGDRIILEDAEGWVESITWRATTIRTCEGMLVHIPNGSMAQELVKVIPPGGQVRRCVEFIVSARVPPQDVINTVDRALLNQPSANVNLDKPLRVKLGEYEFAEEVLAHYKVLYYPLNYSDANNYTDAEILQRVWYALHRQGWFPEYIPRSSEKHLNLISSVEFFRELSQENREILVGNCQSFLFDAGERLSCANLPSSTMFIVAEGCINVEQELITNLSENTFTVKVFSRRPKVQPPVPLSEETVEKVAYQLAFYIGPSAFAITNQVAKEVFFLYWIYQRLAAEINDPRARAEFLSNCPLAPIEQLQRGDFFGEMCLFLGADFPDVKMTAAVATELLAIDRQAIALVLREDESFLALLSHRLAKHQQDYLTETMQMPHSNPLSANNFAQQITTFARDYLNKSSDFNLDKKPNSGSD